MELNMEQFILTIQLSQKITWDIKVRFIIFWYHYCHTETPNVAPFVPIYPFSAILKSRGEETASIRANII